MVGEKQSVIELKPMLQYVIGCLHKKRWNDLALGISLCSWGNTCVLFQLVLCSFYEMINQSICIYRLILSRVEISKMQIAQFGKTMNFIMGPFVNQVYLLLVTPLRFFIGVPKIGQLNHIPLPTY